MKEFPPIFQISRPQIFHEIIVQSEERNNPLRDAGSNVLLGLSKPPAMPVVLTFEKDSEPRTKA